jgi:hypothetical protein
MLSLRLVTLQFGRPPGREPLGLCHLVRCQTRGDGIASLHRIAARVGVGAARRRDRKPFEGLDVVTADAKSFFRGADSSRADVPEPALEMDQRI